MGVVRGKLREACWFTLNSVVHGCSDSVGFAAAVAVKVFHQGIATPGGDAEVKQRLQHALRREIDVLDGFSESLRELAGHLGVGEGFRTCELIGFSLVYGLSQGGNRDGGDVTD